MPVAAKLQNQMEEARRTLREVYGFADFRGGQAEIIAAILGGEDVLAVMPTGSGKSLCYQLPAILRGGLTIIVSPLIALMRDQVQQLREYGISAAALNSTISSEDHAEIMRGIRDKTLRLLYVAPERLARPGTLAMLREAQPDVLAIDEAHCVSQWGHDFRPEYLTIHEAARELGAPQIIAVTATADAPTRDEIVAKLFAREPQIFVHSFDRPNLRLAMQRKENAFKQIAAMVARHKGQNGIVYCSSRNRTEKIATDLSALGHWALPYHAGLDASVRAANQDEFLQNDGVIMVATVAFGMGIDKPDVRYVCHADLPQSIEAYYQEIGRAGRDGLPANTLTLFGEADIQLRQRQIYESDAPQERKRMEERKLEALVALCETPRCRRQTLLAAFGEKSAPCGNCDICDGGLKYFNAAVAAQKVMSAILRTSGRFFAGHVANVLTGKATDAIKRHGHDLLPTFGIGTEFGAAEWRSIFRQLHASELIAQDGEDRDRWVLTPAGRAVLKGEADLQLRAMDEPGVKPRQALRGLQRLAREADDREPMEGTEYAPSASARTVDGAELSTRQASLLAVLKAKRLELAKASRQPAYVIFTDRSLIDMAVLLPRTAEEMSMVHGVGAAKLRRHGAVFLGIIAAHLRDQ